jgi:hypothetical protein
MPGELRKIVQKEESESVEADSSAKDACPA